jgi:hypothetical protein
MARSANLACLDSGTSLVCSLATFVTVRTDESDNLDKGTSSGNVSTPNTWLCVSWTDRSNAYY